MKSDDVPEIASAEVAVPGLGTVKGLSLGDEACQYLGIPYASVPGRFRRSVLADSPWPNGQWDGSKFGPSCPQPPRGFYPVPAPQRPWVKEPAAHELECLRLNITVPATGGGAAPAAGLPVLVFIHGGAFVHGAGSAAIYDGRVLATAAMPDGQPRPTIVVTMNYRLGVFGFLAGRDLAAYNAAVHGEAGVGNYGMWDQVQALRWIQKHIGAFGGDRERVTLFGQSAGAVAVNCHLLRGEADGEAALFSSAILQSGLVRTCGLMSVDEHQAVYERLLAALDIEGGNAESRVRRLLEVDEARLIAAMSAPSVYLVPGITMALCDDGMFLRRRPVPDHVDPATLPVPGWCPRILIGDCRNEGIIWHDSWAVLATTPAPGAGGDDNHQDDDTDDHFINPDAGLVLAKMADLLGAVKARDIARLYGLREDCAPDETFRIVERLTSDGIFRAMIYYAAVAAASKAADIETGAGTKAQTGAVYAYHFDVPSPFPNAWNGLAHHSFDSVLVWGLLSHHLPPVHQHLSQQMTAAWIRFAHGEDPWAPLSATATASQSWMVFGPESAELKSRQDASIHDAGHRRSYALWDQLREAGLAVDLARLSDELCLRRTDLVAAASATSSS